MNEEELEKFKALSRDKQLELIELLEAKTLADEKAELKLQGKMPLRFVEPFPQQMGFVSSPKQVRGVTGGNGSGKTMIGVYETLTRVTKTHPTDTAWNNRKDPMSIMMLVEDTKQAKQTGAAQDVLISMLPEFIDHKKDIVWDKRGVLDHVNFPDGGKVFLRSSRVGRKSLQGSRIHGIHVDENCVKDADFFDEMLMRMTPYGAPLIWITATPNLDVDKDDNFFEEVILERCEDEEKWVDWGLTRISLWDNPYIPEETKNFYLQNLTGGEDQIRARMEGEHRAVSGLVYGEFSPKIHVIPPMDRQTIKEDAVAIFRVIDPHQVKPIAVAFYACFGDGSVIQFDELYHKGLVKDVASRMRTVCDGLGSLIKASIMDYSGNATTNTGAGKSFRQEFLDYGVSVINCHKDTSMGIREVRKMLRYSDENPPIFKVTSNCIKTIKEFSKYKIDMKTQLPKKKTKGDEFMDCIRYLACEPLAKRYFIERGKINGVYTQTTSARVIQEGRRNSPTDAKASRTRARREAQTKLLGVGVGRRH